VRDAVAGGFDDLLHDDVIAELEASAGEWVTLIADSRDSAIPLVPTGRGRNA